jgi:hypothetical protein
VHPEPLVDGLSRRVTAPATLDVSVGEAGLVDLFAHGTSDVRARLYDAEGALVAEGDDRPGDWSFLVSRHLEAGAYRLRVDPVGAPSAQTEVTLRIPARIDGAPWTLPADTAIRPGDAVHVHPLVVEGGGLLVLSAASPETIGLALEVSRGNGAFRTVASRVGRQVRIEVPLPEGAGASRHRVRIWSADRGGSEVRFRAVVARPEPVSEADLARGLPLPALVGMAPPLSVVAVEVARPGAIAMADDGAGEALRWADRPYVPARPVEGAIPRTSGGILWLVRDLHDGATAAPEALQGTRARPPADGHLVLTVPGTAGVAAVDVDPEPSREGLLRRRFATRGPVVVRATARTGQPALVVGEAGEAPLGRGDPAAGALGPASAVAVSLAGTRRVARVWDAEAEGSDASLDVRLSILALTPTEPVPAQPGILEGEVFAGTTAAFDLPGGENRIRLALDGATLAVLSDADEVKSVHGGAGAAHAETLVSRATRLTFMPAEAGTTGRFRVEILPAAGGEARTVARGRPFEARETAAGVLRLAVSGEAAAGPPVVRARGAVIETRLLGADGRVVRGDAPVPPSGGVLLVRHGPGRIFVWLDDPGEVGEGLVRGRDPRRAAEGVTAPAVIPLSGEGVILEVRTGTDAPALLHLRAGIPVAARIEGPGLAPRVDVHPDGLAQDLFVPRGQAGIVLRPLMGGLLSGDLMVTTTPIPRVGEGLGPAVLLGPGEARAFSFVVTDAGPVGVGVQAEADRVAVQILDARGQPVATDGAGRVVAMPRLEPGTYVLLMQADADGEPILVRPALAGLEAPEIDPPADVVRAYLTQAGAIHAD